MPSAASGSACLSTSRRAASARSSFDAGIGARELRAARLLFDVFFFIEWSAVVFGLLAGALAVGCGLLFVEDEEPLDGAGRDASEEDARDDREDEFHLI